MSRRRKVQIKRLEKPQDLQRRARKLESKKKMKNPKGKIKSSVCPKSKLQRLSMRSEVGLNQEKRKR